MKRYFYKVFEVFGFFLGPKKNYISISSDTKYFRKNLIPFEYKGKLFQIKYTTYYEYYLKKYLKYFFNFNNFSRNENFLEITMIENFNIIANSKILLNHFIRGFELGVGLRDILKPLIKIYRRIYYKYYRGIYIKYSGRFSRVLRTKTRRIMIGEKPSVNILNSSVCFSKGFSCTSYGVCGIKVWIFKSKDY